MTDDQKIRTAIRCVKRFLAADHELHRREERYAEPWKQAPKTMARLTQQYDEANQLFFDLIAPNTHPNDRDLIYYGWPEATYEWVAGWLDEEETK